jgi:hypothetical protein
MAMAMAILLIPMAIKLAAILGPPPQFIMECRPTILVVSPTIEFSNLGNITTFD